MSDPSSWMFGLAKIFGGLFLFVLAWESAARLFQTKKNSGEDEPQDAALDLDPFKHLMEAGREAAASSPEQIEGSAFRTERDSPAAAPSEEGGGGFDVEDARESLKRLREIEFDAGPGEKKP